LFKDNGIKPSHINSFDDMKIIPFTYPEDLQNNYEKFLTVPMSKITKIFTSSGCTGKPKKVYLTKNDLDKIIISSVNGLKSINNVTEKDIIRLSFEESYGDEIWGNKYCLDQAFQMIGALTISTGRLKINEEQNIIKNFNPTILMDVTSRINYLTRELNKICELQDLGVKKILTGAEPTPSNLRKGIENLWNADVRIGYGITEVGLLMACECEEKYGMHLNEVGFLTEVCDKDNGDIINDDSIGELIFTTYDRFGMPLIRYNSHDLGFIIRDICNCSLPMNKIIIKGRSDDLLPIGAGDNLFSEQFDQTIFSFPEVEDYQLILNKKNGKDMIELLVEVENNTVHIKNKILNAIVEIPEINNGIYVSKTISKPSIQLLSSNTFKRNSIKLKRIHDNRKLYD